MRTLSSAEAATVGGGTGGDMTAAAMPGWPGAMGVTWADMLAFSLEAKKRGLPRYEPWGWGAVELGTYQEA